MSIAHHPLPLLALTSLALPHQSLYPSTPILNSTNPNVRGFAMSRYSTLLLLLSPCLLVGCGQAPATSQGNVAVVDLDEVANQLGLGEQWAEELSASQTSVNQQLAGFQQQLKQQLQQKHSEVVTANGSADLVPEEQKVQLATYQKQLNDKLRLAQTEAKKHLNGERSRIIKNFREQAEQISADVAKHRGFDVVLTKNETVVLTYTAGADITHEVTKQLRVALANQTQTPSQPNPTTQQ